MIEIAQLLFEMQQQSRWNDFLRYLHIFKENMKICYIHFNHDVIDNSIGWSDIRNVAWDINYGDILVCSAIARQIKNDQNKIDNNFRCDFGEVLRAQGDQALIRGSTYLNNEFNFNAANKTIDSVDSPLTIVGLGAQNSVSDISFLDNNEGARNFISRLNEKSKSISVRGDFTACVVERLGGKNIRVTGCPSLFYSLKIPLITVPEMLNHPERSLGLTIHTELMDNIYCKSPEVAKKLQGHLISFALKNSLKISIFEQGVLNECNASDRKLSFFERFSAAQKIVQNIQTDRNITEYQLLACLTSISTIEEWLSKTRDLDAIIGFRFHGNMMALLQGKPSYYYYYDSRIEEFCKLYRLPGQDVNAEWVNPIIKMQEHDWSKTNDCIKTCFQELTSFYRENSFEINY